jgi:hypothetical protein
MDAYIFINKMVDSACSLMNRHELGIDFYECDSGDHVAMIIKHNLLDGNNFCGTKFSEFILDKSKSLAVPLVLDQLENNGMQLHYCWTNAEIPDTELTRKEKVISYLVGIQDIFTFRELIEAFEPNGLKLDSKKH